MLAFKTFSRGLLPDSSAVKIHKDSNMAKTKVDKKASKSLNTSPAQIWKSRISWRIALAVFLTILAVQAIILNFTLRDFEQSRLNELKEVGRSAIVPLIGSDFSDFLTSPISEDEADALVTLTKVNGLFQSIGFDQYVW